MNIKIREYTTEDAKAASEIWNQVVDDGVAFPQEEEISGGNILGKNWFWIVSERERKKASG